MARGRRPGRFRERPRRRHPDAPLPRAPAPRDPPSGRPHGARQRRRGLGDDTGGALRPELAALRSQRGAPGRLLAHRVLQQRSLAALGLPDRSRDRRRQGSLRAPRPGGRARALRAPRAAARRVPRAQAIPLRPRLPLPQERPETPARSGRQRHPRRLQRRHALRDRRRS